MDESRQVSECNSGRSTQVPAGIVFNIGKQRKQVQYEWARCGEREVADQGITGSQYRVASRSPARCSAPFRSARSRVTFADNSTGPTQTQTPLASEGDLSKPIRTLPSG